jgi:hypothetical protein
MSRRTPMACAASMRLRVPWMRRALVAAMPWCRIGTLRNAVAAWIAASAFMPSTARSRPSQSIRSATNGSMPMPVSRSAPLGERLSPITS